jgi:protection of telomeres protein 1
MAMKPPQGFEELGSAAKKVLDSEFCAMGVVSDFLPASKTKGRDFMITFTLNDPSWCAGEGLKCRFFGRTQQTLPNISSKGDVVILRSVKLKNFNGQPMALSTFKSSWIVIHQQDIPNGITEVKGDLPCSRMSDQGPPPGQDVMAYAVILCNFLDRTTFGVPLPPASLEGSDSLALNGNAVSARPKKYQLIEELVLPRTKRDLKFADLLGEVRKVYMNDSRVELTITDYTLHEALYDYVHTSDDDQGRDGDQFNYNPGQKPWPGPWGKMSMVVTAWDAHASFARDHVGLNSLVSLRNVQINLDRDGSRMEGSLRGDRYHPERIGITICKPRQAQDDDRIKNLLKRKRDYEADLRLHGIKGLEESKKQREESLHLPAKRQKLSKTAERNKKKKEKAKVKKSKTATADPSASRPTTDTFNPSIRTNRVPDTVTPVKISEITDPSVLAGDFKTVKSNTFNVPFKNNLYQLKSIRVIDFHPPNLADFSAPHKPSDYEVLSDHEDNSDIDIDIDMLTGANDSDVNWEWRFELLVEDASSGRSVAAKQGKDKDPDAGARMRLLVAGHDADFLLRNIRATNLREDAASLAKLKEKLFLLWGDLQEKKEEEGEGEGEEESCRRCEEAGGGGGAKPVEPSGRPFQCLVKEYGVQVHGSWERVFAMFGTSIVSD